MKAALSIVLLFLAWSARATVIVNDPVLTADTQANWFASLAKQVHQFEVQLQQQIDEHTMMLKDIQQVENSALQLERMGDPRALINLPGVSNIQTLGAIVQQGEADASFMASLINPKSAVTAGNQILQMYGQPVWNGITSSNGIHINASTTLIQFSASNYNTSDYAQQTIATLRQKKLTLTQQRDQAIAAEAAATDTETRTRYHNQVTSLNGAIADVDSEINHAIQAEQLQVNKNNAAQQITQATQAQRMQASDLQAIDQGISGLPMGSFRQPIYWGTQP